MMQTLVAQVASAYFDLREYDAELEYVRESIASRQESLKLVTARLDGGVANMLEVDQAKSLVASAQATRALLEKAQEQTENLINFLVARQPGPVARGKSLVDQPQPPGSARRTALGAAGTPSRLACGRAAADRSERPRRRGEGCVLSQHQPHGAGGYQSSDLLGVVSRAGGAYASAGSSTCRSSTRVAGGKLQNRQGAARGDIDQLSEGDQRRLPRCFRCAHRIQKTREYTGSRNCSPRRCAIKAGSPTHVNRWRQQLSGGSRHRTPAADCRTAACPGPAGCSDVACAVCTSRFGGGWE